MPSRRDLLKVLGTSVASTAVVGAAHLKPEQTRLAILQLIASGGFGASPWCLLAPLSAGDSLGKGWSMHALGPVEGGAAVLQLKNRDGRIARIHICARQGSSAGLTHTHLLDLVLMDGGDGSKQTDERLARVISGLAKRMARNELAAIDPQTLDAMSRMLTHEQRMAVYGPETLI